MNKLVSKILDRGHKYRDDLNEISPHSLCDIDVLEMLDVGLSSEMIAATFQCPVEEVEARAELDRNYLRDMGRLNRKLEREWSEYDYNNRPFLGHYPMRK